MASTSTCKTNSPFAWSRELTKSLIELYQNYPCLYLVSSKEFHNKNLRSIAIQEICDILNQKHLCNLKEQDVKTKLHGIRTQYLNEIRNIKKSKVTGSSTDNVYIPKLWSFDLLSFLGGAEVVSKGESNLSQVQASSKKRPLEIDSDNESSSQTERHDMEKDDGAIDEVIQDVVFDGDITELDNITITPVFSPPVSRTPSRTSSLDTPISKKRKSAKKLNKTMPEMILEEASATLRSLNAKRENLKTNEIFGEMVGAEMETIKDEEILDNLKETIMLAIYRAKADYRDKRSRLASVNS